jgi:hypothetical protein
VRVNSLRIVEKRYGIGRRNVGRAL